MGLTSGASVGFSTVGVTGRLGIKSEESKDICDSSIVVWGPDVFPDDVALTAFVSFARDSAWDFV